MTTKNWIIQLCEHCDSVAQGKNRFCNDCKTAESRLQMDENNIKLFKERGLEYECRYCSGKQREREQKIVRDKKFAGVLS